MACPVTPSPDLIVSDLEELSVQPRDWSGLPADLLYRIATLLEFQTDVPSLMLTCYAWHSSLKAQITSLQIHYLGKPALNNTYNSLRYLHAPLRRRTPFGLTYFAPLRSSDTLGVQFPSLVSINLAGQQLKPHGLAVLEPLSGRLQHLDASGCELSRHDVSSLGTLTHLTALELNAVRAWPWGPVSSSLAGRPEMALAAELAAVLPGLTQLRRLALGMKEQTLHDAGSLSGEATRLRQQHAHHAAPGQHWQAHQAGGPADHGAGRALRAVVLGLPLLHLASCLTSLTSLSCLLLHHQPLHACDVAAIATLTTLTELAITWNPRGGSNIHPAAHTTAAAAAGGGSPPQAHPPHLHPHTTPGPGLQLTVAVWDRLMYGMQHHLAVLDVDFAGWDVRERMSLAPLRRLRALRLRRCWSPDLLLSLMGPVGPALPSTAAAATAAAVGSRTVTGAPLRRPVAPAAVAGGSGPGLGVSGGWSGCTGLVRLEMPEAGEPITPALVAQVCSRLPQLRILDMSRAFRTRARFQLGGDLLVRDLAVLCPQLVQLVLFDVPMHGVGLPDGRDLLLLPFFSPSDEAPPSLTAKAEGLSRPTATPSAAGYNHTALASTSAAASASSRPAAATVGVGLGGAGHGGAAAAAPTPPTPSPPPEVGPAAEAGEVTSRGGDPSTRPVGPSTTSDSGGGARGAAGRELVQLPFPRLRSLVLQGGSVFMKSRFRSISNLRGLQRLQITGMTEKDFLATCKMGCYDELSALSALTALHINAKQPPPLPPAAPGLHPEGGLHPPLNLNQHQPVPPLHPQLYPQQQHPQAGPQGALLPGAVAGQPVGGGGGDGGPGPSMYGSAGPSSSSPRREPHLNFITRLGTLRVLTLEALTTRGLIFSYLGQLRHLQALSLGGCMDLSFEGLERLRRASLPSLRSLRMLGCQWDSAEASELLPCLSCAAPDLSELELGSCPGITAHRLAAALRELPRLRYARLHGAAMSPASVREAPLACGDLRFLSCIAAPGRRGMDSGATFCMARWGDTFELVDVEDGGTWPGVGLGTAEDGLLEAMADGAQWPG